MGDGNARVSWVDEELRPPELTTQERKLRRCFAEEFVASGENIEHAAMRIGFDYVFARTWGEILYNDGYTLRCIDEVRGRPITEEEQEAIKNRTVRQLVAETQKNIGKGTARVAALDKLSRIFGLTEEPDEVNDKNKGGVMQVPAMTTAEEWMKMAEPEQAQLKADVRE